MFAKETYIARRAKLKQAVGSGLLLFIGNDEAGMNYADNTYHYRQDSTFLYFFGLPYDGLSAVIDIDNDREIIFGDELSIDAIVWMGTQPTLKEKSELSGMKEVLPAKEIVAYLKKAQEKKQEIHYLPTYRPEHQIKLQNWLGIYPGTEKPSVPFIYGVVNQRNYKTEEEIVEIERACNVTVDMHAAAMRMIRPGIKEYEVAAVVAEAAKKQGCELSFPIIATINGQTLHNHYHGNTLKSGQMLLLDAGAETDSCYAGDMSSTIPVDSKFTTRQRDIYDIQVASHEAAVAALRPGVKFEDVYDLSLTVIMDGLKELGFVKGDTKEAVKAGAAALFMPCGLGHMMGMDVHDMENLGEVYVGYNGRPKSTQFGRKSLRLGRELEPGFVLTIEPGIYFIPELIDLWRKENRFAEFINYDKVETYKDFSGIRNEEDFLITADGARLLGKKLPLHAEDVEALHC
ncbi:aminopeptidase P family protein [Parabacteroides sp. PF5-6]|uniref:aminopeptidase P family protein n=1 Tax=Parabacteroides sp. PF5-6 TaxID=1742403 RepID=UPI002405FB98|nr:aminopeptidase P family protein [Parabacteroides sp. PF5-6]MDF9829560.1 Xaa-Pro aminopeptidase [Parabacteroides sp. PF5-6]